MSLKDKDPNHVDKMLELLRRVTNGAPKSRELFDGKEFSCLHCGFEFNKNDVKQMWKCSQCKTPNQIVKNWEALTESQKAAKYSPNVEEQIAGPSSKFVVGNQIKAYRNGKR
jgi:predicted Zn-ribbon and HTH transcriptional regulator